MIYKANKYDKIYRRFSIKDYITLRERSGKNNLTIINTRNYKNIINASIIKQYVQRKSQGGRID